MRKEGAWVHEGVLAHAIQINIVPFRLVCRYISVYTRIITGENLRALAKSYIEDSCPERWGFAGYGVWPQVARIF